MSKSPLIWTLIILIFYPLFHALTSRLVPGGFKLEDVVRLINDVDKTKDLVALTVAEPMPRLAIRLKSMLARLPLVK